MTARASVRQVVLLSVLVAGLVGVAAYQFRDAVSTGARAAPPAAPAVARVAVTRDRVDSAPDVRLDALTAARPEPAASGRDLFRERPKAPPPPPTSTVSAPASAPDPHAPPPPPPPPPPVPLKLLAIVRGAGRPVAGLTDGRDVFYGCEGDNIEGRYKILKINVESVDVAYVDGRGQQRLRLVR
jgi:hypothetical protein